jgi:hypothetical protein
MRILIEAKPIKPKSDFKTTAKIVGKNVLHDSIAGGLFGAALMGYRNKAKMLGKGALIGAGVGAASGLGEGLLKRKIFKNKSDVAVKKTVSSPAYKGLNVGLTSGYHTAINAGINRILGEKMGWKGAAAAAAIGAAEDIASTANDSKVYGPDAPEAVGASKQFTKDSLKTGMFSKKKYKYGGLGPEIKKKKASKSV